MASSDYTWLHALAGGMLIGLGSLLAAAATGKLPGISGMCSRLLRPRRADAAWRVLFLLGLLLGAGAVFWLVSGSSRYASETTPLLASVAGLLVGFGTRLSGGCTSGHGVCGIGLGSKPAILATLAFMAAGIATVYVLRHTPVGEFIR